MKKFVWFVIWLIITYFYVQVIIWVANNHPIYVSVPVIWITMSIWACIWWWRMTAYIRHLKEMLGE